MANAQTFLWKKIGMASSKRKNSLHSEIDGLSSIFLNHYIENRSSKDRQQFTILNNSEESHYQKEYFQLKQRESNSQKYESSLMMQSCSSEMVSESAEGKEPKRHHRIEIIKKKNIIKSIIQVKSSLKLLRQQKEDIQTYIESEINHQSKAFQSYSRLFFENIQSLNAEKTCSKCKHLLTVQNLAKIKISQLQQLLQKQKDFGVQLFKENKYLKLNSQQLNESLQSLHRDFKEQEIQFFKNTQLNQLLKQNILDLQENISMLENLMDQKQKQKKQLKHELKLKQACLIESQRKREGSLNEIDQINKELLLSQKKQKDIQYLYEAVAKQQSSSTNNSMKYPKINVKNQSTYAFEKQEVQIKDFNQNYNHQKHYKNLCFKTNNQISKDLQEIKHEIQKEMSRSTLCHK